MRKRSVYSPFTERMGIAFRLRAHLLLAHVLSPKVSVCKEESLLRRKTLFCCKRMLSHHVSESLESNRKAAMISYVLTEG